MKKSEEFSAVISGRSYHRSQVSVPPMLLDPDVTQFWEAQVLSSSCDLVLVRISFLDSNFECPRTSSNIFDPFLWRITWPRWPHLRRHLLQQWIHRLAKAHCCSRGPLGQTESKRSDKFRSWHVWNKNFEHLWTIWKNSWKQLTTADKSWYLMSKNYAKSCKIQSPKKCKKTSHFVKVTSVTWFRLGFHTFTRQCLGVVRGLGVLNPTHTASGIALAKRSTQNTSHGQWVTGYCDFSRLAHLESIKTKQFKTCDLVSTRPNQPQNVHKDIAEGKPNVSLLCSLGIF